MKTILTTSIAAMLASAAFATDHIGAQPVTDINTLGDSNPDNVSFSNDRLYFTATDKNGKRGIYAKKLVRGPLAAADPVLNRKPAKIKNLTTRGVTKAVNNFVRAFEVNIADKMFFHVVGDGLFTTKGSALSTIRVLKFNAGAPDGDAANAYDPQVTPYFLGDNNFTMGVIFAGQGKNTGVEPFVSNGKPGKGTHIVKDINPGAGHSFPYGFLARPSGIFPDQIFFGAFDPVNFYQCHVTTAETEATTGRIGGVNVSSTESLNANLATFPHAFALAGNDVMFAAENAPGDLVRDVGLFKTSDSTFEFLTNADVDPFFFTYGTGTEVFFNGLDAATGRELWVGSGFGEFAQVHDDIVAGTGSSSPHLFHTFTDGQNTSVPVP